MARLLLSSLDLLEAELHWQHEQFTEIRVTVEQADTRRAARWFSLRPRRHGVSYRTAPLVKTMRQETSALVSLQGPPGSGKSVALRQFARFLLGKAARNGSLKYPLALYVSLRDLNVAPDAITTPALLRIQLAGMSTKEQFTLLRAYGMPRKFESAIDELLRDPRIGFSTDLRNPLYLGLLCRYVRATNRIPGRPSELFEGYIARQLEDSADVEREGLLETLQAFSFELTNRAETRRRSSKSATG